MKTLLLLAVPVCLMAQNATAPRAETKLAADPATCSPGVRYYNTTSNGERLCTATNTWSNAGGGSGGGGLVLVEQHTASNSAELDFTTCLTSSYDDYQIELVNVLPATNSDQLKLQFSTNAGASYITTAYSWLHLYSYGLATSAWEGSNSDTGISIGGSSVANTGAGICGTLHLYNPGAAGTTNKSCTMDTTRYHASLAAIVHDNPSSGQLSVAAVNAFRLLFGSGNITSGTVRCYGVAKQ